MTWAATDGNVGANVLHSLGYEMAFVIAPDGTTVYSVIAGVPQVVAAQEHFPTGLADLLDLARLQAEPAVGLLSSDSPGVALVAATPIRSPSSNDKAISLGDRSILIFADRLDARFLERMSDEYLLRDLALIEEGAPSRGATIPLLNSKGESIGQLMWHPEKPGYELLRLLLPPLSLSAIVFVAFATLVVSNARKSTLALEDSARTVEAYAQTLQESEARFRDVAEASSDWIWECDPNLRFA